MTLYIAEHYEESTTRTVWMMELHNQSLYVLGENLQAYIPDI
jgi:hypothetical protein